MKYVDCPNIIYKMAMDEEMKYLAVLVDVLNVSFIEEEEGVS